MAKKKEHFEGTIVIGDPCSMVSCEEDWQTAKWGERMDALGIGAFLSIEFEEDIREIVDDRGPVLGEFCTDSCVVVVVGLEDLLKYNPPFKSELASYPQNFTVIKDFMGDVTYRKKGDECQIVGKGNVDFASRSKDE